MTAETKIVKLSDIARCPKQSLLASHYRADGSCLCQPDAELQRLAGLVLARPDAAEALEFVLEQPVGGPSCGCGGDHWACAFPYDTDECAECGAERGEHDSDQLGHLSAPDVYPGPGEPGYVPGRIGRKPAAPADLFAEPVLSDFVATIPGEPSDLHPEGDADTIAARMEREEWRSNI